MKFLFSTYMQGLECIYMNSYLFNVYDATHSPLPRIKEGDWVRIKYTSKDEPGYHAPYAPTSKFAPRYSTPYQVVRKVSPWAYELALPEGDRTHPVFPIAMIRPVKADEELHGLEAPEVIQEEEEALYEVDAIVGKRMVGKGRKTAEYLVKWRNVDKPEWEPMTNLEGCTEAIMEFEASLLN